MYVLGYWYFLFLWDRLSELKFLKAKRYMYLNFNRNCHTEVNLYLKKKKAYNKFIFFYILNSSRSWHFKICTNLMNIKWNLICYLNLQFFDHTRRSHIFIGLKAIRMLPFVKWLFIFITPICLLAYFLQLSICKTSSIICFCFRGGTASHLSVIIIALLPP